MHSILHNVYIRSTVDQVFQALTGAEHINQWWTLECHGLAEINEEFRFYFSPEYDWTAKVTHVIANKALEWKMLKADNDWTPTSFGFELFQLEEMTRVEFYHKDWTSTNEHFRKTSYCWAMYLNLLKRYVEMNEVVPFEKRTFI